ncbi:hypothetical protein NE865_15612 [Phthorimaea operculella]|nr:hypothetical protein NE865_15612 [Phthorimaea operculella]
MMAIISGSLILNVTMKESNISLKETMGLANATKSYDAAKKSSNTIACTIAVCMGFVFCASGIILLVANMFDEDGYVQIFVWLIFVNICVGIIGVLYTGVLCSYSTCPLSKMDWLTGALILIAVLVYLVSWIYFVSVANSYILQKTT